jgi:hypothetical protein
VQAILGLILIEYAWAKTKRFRKIDENRDGKYPYFRRIDVQIGGRAKFYPGALLTMPTRIILLLINIIVLEFMVK